MKTNNNLMRNCLLLAVLISSSFLSSFTDREKAVSAGPKKVNHAKSASPAKSNAKKASKVDVYCIGVRTISGVTYTFEGDYPTSNVIMRITWSSGTTGIGTFGTFYVNGLNILCANVPSTPIHYDGPILACGD
jgi:hypothetical protein